MCGIIGPMCYTVDIDRQASLCRVAEVRDLRCDEIRHAWLLEKLAQMRQTHSRLLAEAEDRVSDRALSWSQLLFTDLFGPDVARLGHIASRLSRLEMNMRSFASEARQIRARQATSAAR